ncbi:hypothetical protein X943_000097 [Babesia divergens]|uniref:CTLH/CRA C-terminal to LisH motif domain-containing protein n=1 Tax=Babesia divergens TaxID=32595 RepID=A0AAD9G6E1_BABDI|nr:hypothetical protein X943_000097 [Babesia divergens]
MGSHERDQRQDDVASPHDVDSAADQRKLTSDADTILGSHRATTGIVSSKEDATSLLNEADARASLLLSVSPTDRPLLAVPYTFLQSYLTEMERVIEKELLLVTSYLSKRIVHLDSRQLVLEKLNRALERLQQLDESLHRIDYALSANLSQLKSRIATLHMEPLPSIDSVDIDFRFDNYCKRISWVVADYLARQGYLNSASSLANIECIGELIDMDLYRQCDEIYRELHAHKLDAVLRWAESHRDSLTGIRSNFLGQLKVQQVVMCLKDGDVDRATSHMKSFTREMLACCAEARKLFSAIVFLNTGMRNAKPNDSEDISSKSEGQASPCSDDHMASDDKGDVTMTSLPIVCVYCGKVPNEACEVCTRYLELISHERWEYLSREFKRCMLLVYKIGPQSLLENLIQTGFCAIKSTSCGDHRNSTCPACLPEWKEYVENVPASHKLNSPLICPITGQVMTYDNPPFASPGGYVLSERGIRTLTQMGSDGHLAQCPKTKEFVHQDDFQKIFIT